MNTPAPLPALQPCPFCGAAPTEQAIEPHKHAMLLDGLRMPDHPGSHVIECGCGAGLIDDTRTAVVSRWNRRPALAAQPAPDAERAARIAAQTENEALKDRLARARLDLMRELREQGWTPPAAHAQQPAPVALTDADLMACVRKVSQGTHMRLSRDVGPYDMTEPSPMLRALADAILAAAGIPAPTTDTTGEQQR